jgi:hypothetical protein
MWRSAGQFLNRFKNLKLSKTFIQKESAEAMAAVLKIKIKPEDVQEINGTLFVKSNNSSLRNEIFLKKREILNVLRQRLGPKAPRDIR